MLRALIDLFANKVYSLGAEGTAVVKHILSLSSHREATDVIGEALGIAEIIYEEASQGRTVECAVENGKIVVYTYDTDDPDDGEPLPQPEEVAHLVEQGRQAA